MQTVNLRSFAQIVHRNKKRLNNFLRRLEKLAPRGLDDLIKAADQVVWKEINCIDCANCCKTMSPTYTRKDVKRISIHLGLEPKVFRDKWLYKDEAGDWLNVSKSCQFLDGETNKCGIYDVRPADCAGFPHHTKKRMVDYMHVYRQNIEHCPATYRIVEKMMNVVERDWRVAKRNLPIEDDSVLAEVQSAV